MNNFALFPKWIVVLNIFFVMHFVLFSVLCNAIPFENDDDYKNKYHTNTFYSNGKLKNRKMLNDIKEAFKMFPNVDYILQYMVPKILNMNDSNPAYIFAIPDRNNNMKKIMFRRDDFDTPIYPNLTATDIILNRVLRKNVKVIPSIAIPSDVNIKLQKLNQNENDYSDDEILMAQYQNDEDAILENVRTERNFINYVNYLNTKEKIVLSSNQKRKKQKNSNEWKRLGLSGWEGSLSVPKGLSDDRSFLSATESSRSLRMNQKELLDLKSIELEKLFTSMELKQLDNFENIKVWDLPGKVSSINGQQLELKVNQTLLRMFTTSSNNTEWPITTSRENHHNSDVFIGRANDPFGHSTKWETRNETELNEDRQKRAIIELYSMIKCSTGCDPLIFKGYGCYCGFSGSGRPVDGIDRCCKLHDICYEKSICPSFLEYFVPYLWKCYKGKPLCAISHGEWGGSNSCATRLCQCDLLLSKCLQKYKCPRKRAICRTSGVRMLQNFLTIL